MIRQARDESVVPPVVHARHLPHGVVADVDHGGGAFGVELREQRVDHACVREVAEHVDSDLVLLAAGADDTAQRDKDGRPSPATSGILALKVRWHMVKIFLYSTSNETKNGIEESIFKC